MSAPAGTSRPLLKVCGATSPEEAAAVAPRADLVGLWYGVENGARDLTRRRLTAVAAAVRTAGRAEPVLVTFLHDAAQISEAARAAGVRWIQLHAYQPPAAVAALRRAMPDAVLVKAVHVLDGACVERPFLTAYARAGADLILVDTATRGGAVGSTGHRVPAAALESLLPALPRPFLLAGGLDEADAPGRAFAARPGYRGVDIDNAARTDGGPLDPVRVAALDRAWTGTGDPAP
ncbi:N-(5'-phosphoribosyl)anthranilate isomerase [Streptomyces durocortorensis]|uniref:N-(5'-phosphoribosyl)anthranilate isomerase n=1 Tax=Streptomyces durocortorensis TaxID=2811104 RepID=A0ABS2HRV9_9ACTN|nr:N-(5'-phosphoribosyl)anthranilate isomerase [Streptomyces durocortorensis]MBM7053811.1 N-(5'-phosphoribosyl)anthranilate isomerase [Streptomyces durocortorensis]